MEKIKELKQAGPSETANMQSQKEEKTGCSFCNENETHKISLFPDAAEMVLTYEAKFDRDVKYYGGTLNKTTISTLLNGKAGILFHIGLKSEMTTPYEPFVMFEGVDNCSNATEAPISPTLYTSNDENFLVKSYSFNEINENLETLIKYPFNSAKTDVPISNSDAIRFQNYFKNKFGTHNACAAGYFDGNAIKKIIDYDKCVGLRYYFGFVTTRKQNEYENFIRVILVGVNNFGGNIIFENINTSTDIELDDRVKERSNPKMLLN